MLARKSPRGHNPVHNVTLSGSAIRHSVTRAADLSRPLTAGRGRDRALDGRLRLADEEATRKATARRSARIIQASAHRLPLTRLSPFRERLPHSAARSKSSPFGLARTRGGIALFPARSPYSEPLAGPGHSGTPYKGVCPVPSRFQPIMAGHFGTFVPFGPVWSRSFHGSHMNRFPLCSLATRRLALSAASIDRMNALRWRSASASGSSFGPAFSAMAV